MRELLALLPKPSRYLGIEEGAVLKPAHDIRLRTALIFPDMYEVGMSYLGQKILYTLVNAREHWQAERVFTPCREAGAILRRKGAPLCTLETDTPLADMDVLGFSVTHELCYTNILYVLDLAGIPLRASERAKRTERTDRAWPLVLAGGGCTLSAEPLAPFVDAMLLGEAEESLPEVLERVQECRENGATRQQTLRALARIPGVYVPEFFSPAPDKSLRPLHPDYSRATRRVVRDMDAAPYPVSQPIPFGAVHNRLALEIGRGCTRGCRFCQAGSLYRPARERSVPRLRQLLEECLSGTGYDDVSYLSLSTGDFSALKELFLGTVERCAREQVSVSLPSLRVGSIDDAIMGGMAGIRRTGATLAPEAGSQRLRDVINKGVTEEDLILHVQKLFEHGWQQVKLYFMIGLPTETDDDLLAIIDLCRKARDAAGPGIKRLQITAALSPFVPKPHTPFQWEAQISLPEIRRRVGLLLEAVKKEKRIKLRWHEPDMSLLEGVFSRGDRRLADVVESAYRKGAVFASWMEGFSLHPWLEALEEHGLRLEDYTGPRDPEGPLPWDHLHSGLSREFLLRERRRALAGKTTGDCRYAACNQCGVCDTKAAPSLLDRLPDMADMPDTGYANILNRPQRDQEAHRVSLDAHGRVIVRGQESGSGQSHTSPEHTNQSHTGPEHTSQEHANQPHPGQAATGRTDAGQPLPEDRIPPDRATGGRSKPPALAPHLIRKAAQLRMHYARKGPAAYLSQLEVQHIFERALRRADMPLTFSQGFHPLPLVSFGRALPVGVASECEWFSVYLREPRPLRESLEALNASLPRGLRVMSIEALPLEKRGADQMQETYLVEGLMPEDERPAFFQAWQRVEQSASLPWLREGKKGTRTLDARAFLHRLVCPSPHSAAGCELVLDWSKGYVSPLALCLFMLEAVGHPVALPLLRLTRKH